MDTVSESADLAAPDGTMVTFSYRPADGQRYPAVIVLPEIFGVDDQIKDATRRFAAEGYFATAPDPFHRSGRNKTVPYSGTREETQALQVDMSHDGIVGDLNAVMAYLKGHP